MEVPFLELIKDFLPEYEAYLRDESRVVGRADSISFPKTSAEVQEIVRYLYARDIPFTIQGGRTGLAASAVPMGGHILNLGKMGRILGARYEEESDSFFLTVEPALLLSQLRKTLENKDFDISGWSADSRRALEHFRPGEWFFTPDPTETSAAIGGMIGCNASGARSFLYGATRPWIESLDLVLADGRTLQIRRGVHFAQGRDFRLPLADGTSIQGQIPGYAMPKGKNASGIYALPGMDLIDLFIGSEGLLGIVTAAEIRLHRSPRSAWGITAFLPDEAAALQYVLGLRAFAHKPAAIEFFNDRALALLRQQKAGGAAFSQLQDIKPAYHTAIYTEFHGQSEDELWQLTAQVGALLESLGSSEADTWVATNARDMEKLHLFRHAVPESVNMRIDERRRQDASLTKLGSDMAVPDADLLWVMDLYRRDLEAGGFDFVIFGHIGNNHVHCNIIPRDAEEYARGKALYKQWARQITARGGTVSAEHGIGKLKRDFLSIMYGEAGIAEMRRLKTLFDPKGLMNQGNMF